MESRFLDRSGVLAFVLTNSGDRLATNCQLFRFTSIKIKMQCLLNVEMQQKYCNANCKQSFSNKRSVKCCSYIVVQC